MSECAMAGVVDYVEQSPHNTSAASSGAAVEAGSNDELLDLRKYLLLLAILAATVTYVAGLNPPGGVWLDTQDGHLTGNQILVVTYHARYNAFSYSNATAFMASAVVILLLLLLVAVKEKVDNGISALLFVVLRLVMALDLLALVVSYAAGASRDTLTTVLASLLVSPIFIYILLLTGTNYLASTPTSPLNRNDDDAAADDDDDDDKEEVKRRHKILMLVAIFATTITYTAGLNPPGGFWPVTQDGHHRAGDPVLQGKDHHRRRFVAFFICNTCSFVASLSIVVLLLTRQANVRLLMRKTQADRVPVYGSIVIAILGLLGAYAVGSCRETYATTYVGVLCLVGLALVLVLAYVTRVQLQGQGTHRRSNGEKVVGAQSKKRREDQGHGLNTARSLVLLLATLAATVAFQAGLNPPGGMWPDDRDDHKGGDPILLTKHATRYRVFFYCNSTALAASLVVIFMVQRNYLTTSELGRHALEAVMVLDLIGLIGAFATGSCRDVSTSIYVIALAGGALVYVVFHMVFFTLHRKHGELHKGGTEVEKQRKLLLLLAILAVTLTYQAGLTPPGGFWLEDDDDVQLGHHAGDPVLRSNYPRRYTAFFYLNATGFMASVALTILLVNPHLYVAAINCHALYVCMVAALLGLMGAYAAGSSRHVRTSIYMIALIALVFTVILLLLLIFVIVTRRDSREEEKKLKGRTTNQEANQEANKQDSSSSTPSPSDDVNGGGDDDTSSTAATGNIKLHTRRRYLTLLGILAASVTYQAGLAPPGGVWPDNSDRHAVGNPILRDSNNLRYHIFFYCNSVSIVASVVVITLQLLVRITSRQQTSKPEETTEEYTNKQANLLVQAADYTMAVDLVGLLGAYAAGSSREWETFGYILALVAAVLLYIVIHLLLSHCHRRCCGKQDLTH